MNNIKRTEEWLDERYIISTMEDTRPQDISYYNGALESCLWLGYDYIRDNKGKHTLTKR